MKCRYIFFLTLLSIVLSAVPEMTFGADKTQTKTQLKPEEFYSLSFETTPLDIVLDMYSGWAGRTILKNDAVTASITLKGTDLTKEECMEAIETVLSMNNIALIPMGDKFLKVVAANGPALSGEGLEITMGEDQVFGKSDKLVTHIVTLKYIEIPEVQAAVQHLMHAFGKIQTLERNNSMMITDTAANLRRILDIVEFLDQPTSRIEPRVYQVQYAEAEKIAAKLNEIVEMAKASKQQSTTSRTSSSAARTPPGVIRARRPSTSQAPTQATISTTEDSNTVIIRGTVKIMADERTNIVLIFSQEENFEFFDRIVEVLDIEVEPPISFEVINLEYADAEELAGTLNDLVGSVQNDSKSKTGSSTSPKTGQQRGSTSLAPTQRVAPKTEASASSETAQSLSKLSENTKILADKRTNSLLLMGRRFDIAALKNVISGLDIMLEQVLIEAAIFEVTVGDDLEHGFTWLYNSEDGNKKGAWDGLSNITGTNQIAQLAAGALSYYQNFYGINTKTAIKLAASDGNVRLLATPVIMTTDNTEASLSIGEQRPVVTATETSINSANLRSSYEYKDIGIQLTVTPRINPQRFVVMEINQKADQVGDEIPIDGNPVPVILNREFEAAIAVPDRGTVALGGLVNTEKRDSKTKIPILGDIPFIGRYLFSTVNEQERKTELVVLMTPYVLTNPYELESETKRLYNSTDMQVEDWPTSGWSDSSFAKPETEVMLEQMLEGAKQESR